ncbi:hypothetical protein [Microbacterium paraoxydans]|uniref:hypothetical protein n=1 Tax=Microbacterium paraoxydans TaxID=199592 RepID=UPI003D7657B3
MASAADKAMGIVERTSAEVGELPWTSSSEKRLGYLFAVSVGGQPVAGFEVAPGQVILELGRENLVSVRKVSGAMTIVVELTMRSTDGSGEIVKLGMRGPSGRMKRVFAFLGHPL